MAGDDDPGPPVRGGRVTQFRGGPAKDLLEQPEGVLKIETAKERLPAPVHLTGPAPVREHHSQSGLGLRSPGR